MMLKAAIEWAERPDDKSCPALIAEVAHAGLRRGRNPLGRTRAASG
jgi:hypothetical protein